MARVISLSEVSRKMAQKGKGLIMSWIKLDDQWMDHPKIIRAGRDARDIWLASITWCAKHLTDGYFPTELLPSLAVMAGVDVANCQTFARTLLDLCLWDATDDGYIVHDYLDYNPTKEQTETNRIARSEAGKAGGLAKASKTWQNSSKMPSKTLANGKQNPGKSLPRTRTPYPIKNKEESSSSLFPIAKALSTVTGIDFDKNKGRIFKEAKTYKPGDEDQILRDYSQGGSWYKCDWRGKKNERPGLAQVRETWGNLKKVAIEEQWSEVH